MFSAWTNSSRAEGPAVRSLETDSPVIVASLMRTPKASTKTTIRRNVVPLLQQDNVARDESFSEQPDRLAIAEHIDLLRKQPRNAASVRSTRIPARRRKAH